MSERRIRRPFLWLLTLAALVWVAGTGIGYLKTTADIAYIEAHVMLPKEARAVAQYERFYIRKNGVVQAVYHGQPFEARNRNIFWWIGHSHIVGENELPNPTDGGCWIVWFKYDPRSKVISESFCNGEA